MPSRGEGFGLVFIEAMRAARGCIGGHGSASEIIVDGDTGFVVDPRDRAHLRQVVVRMLRDRTAPRRWALAAAPGSCSTSPKIISATGCTRCCLTPRTRRVRGRVESPWCLTRREHPRHQRVSRRRVGGAGPRRPARRGGRRRAVPPHQARARVFPHQAIAVCLEMGGLAAVGRRRVRRVARSARPPLAQGAVPAEAPAEGDGRVAGSQPGQPACAARDDCRRRSDLDEARRASADAVRRAPSGASRQRRFVVAVRRGGGLRDRRLRRLRQHVVGPRRRHAVVRRWARVLPALARPALSRDHAVPRVPELRRRVQGDGPRAVRRAAVRARDRIARAA